MRLRTNEPEPKWETPDVRCGLPLRDPGRFQPVDSVAAESMAGLVMAGGIEGIFRNEALSTSYSPSSNREFTGRVTLPPTWLFCSGDHNIMVVSEDEAE